MTGKYDDYLLSDDWTEFAISFKAEKGNRCEVCGSEESLHVHHLKYSDNLKNEADLIVLCEFCHKCFHRLIDRYKKQTITSYVMPITVQKNILRKSVLDLYQNSLYKPASTAKYNFFDIKQYCAVRDMMLHQVKAKFPQIETLTDSGYIRNYLSVVSLGESGVIEWRNAAILDAINMGIPNYMIQKRFRISEGTYYKILNKLKE